MKKTIIRKSVWMAGAALGTLLGTVVWGQDAPDRVTVPFSDASKPRVMNVTLINGGMTIRGYSGNEAIIEGRGGSSERHRRPSNVPEGMHQIVGNSYGLDVTEDGNTITVKGGITRSADLTIQVPQQTSLKVRTMNGGAIVIENVSGEIDAQNMNGPVTITNVEGTVLANSMNGRVVVSLNRVTPNKTMSFSTMNGTIDVTLPADVKATLKMKTDNGEIYTDFDVKVDGSHPPTVEDNRKSGGKYRVKIDKAMYGTINGGGPEMQFVTYNGNILIHKK
ncbi:MAG TPA: DUF4097 family beta strand repeat-containing protein [Bryobacteraceae bacterium]|nr:DUF4097 family beta strand repeat-containing protein [Bryobacteraceae bacterium]